MVQKLILNKIRQQLLKRTKLNKILFSRKKVLEKITKLSYSANKRFLNYHINSKSIQPYRRSIMRILKFYILKRNFLYFKNKIYNKTSYILIKTTGAVISYYYVWGYALATYNYNYTINLMIYLYLALILIVFVYVIYNVHYNIPNFTLVYIYIYYFLFLISLCVNYISYHYIFNIYIIFDFRQFIQTDYLFFSLFNINNTNSIFATTTTQIAFLTNIYTYSYMKNEKSFNRFFILINLFSFSMIFLIYSSTILAIFFFWELIGIFSFFLINFLYCKPTVIKAALKAFSFNRVSDVSILTAFIIYYVTTNTILINKHSLYLFINNACYINFFNYKINTLNLFVFFLTVAAFIKSAQFPLHFWLPDSMEAPVPASALIHSATLVSAGLFLFLKFSIIIYSSNLIMCILSFNCITLLLSSITASCQTDIKKLLAYSTINNCSFMFISFFLSSHSSTTLYFSLHGWLKSISFFSAGLLILFYKHNQDTRLMSSNTYVYILCTNTVVIQMSMLSFWFYSLNSSLKHIVIYNNYIYMYAKATLVFSALFSYLYSMRLYILIFSAYSVNTKYAYFIIHRKLIYIIFTYLIVIHLMYFLIQKNQMFINSDSFSFLANTLIWSLIISIVCLYTKYNALLIYLFLL